MLSRWPGAALLLALGASFAHAGDATDTWNLTFTPYAWIPGIDGSAKVPPAAGLPDQPVFPIGKSSVLNALKFAFMGSFEARKGDWSIYADYNYASLGFDKQARTNVVLRGEVDFDQTIFNLAGVRRLWSDANGSHFDVLLGARYIDVNSDIKLTLPNRQFKFNADRDDVDAILGIKGEARLGSDDRWFVPFYGDIGGGSSNHSWLASVGLGYAFGWGDLSLNYRYFEFNPGANSPIEDIRMYGPTLAAAFHF